jgi:photosystem I subunit 8
MRFCNQTRARTKKLVFVEKVLYNRKESTSLAFQKLPCFWECTGSGNFKEWFKGVSMAAQFLPSILVPLVGLVFPAVAMASMFLYIEKEEIN